MGLLKHDVEKNVRWLVGRMGTADDLCSVMTDLFEAADDGDMRAIAEEHLHALAVAARDVDTQLRDMKRDMQRALDLLARCQEALPEGETALREEVDAFTTEAEG